jgi:hypothetical protein
MLIYYVWNIVYSFVILSMLIHIYHRINSRYERFSRQMDTLRQLETNQIESHGSEIDLDHTMDLGGQDSNYGTNHRILVV